MREAGLRAIEADEQQELLIFEDRAGGAAGPPPAAAAPKRPVWDDPDDALVEVNVASRNRLRKLRQAEEEVVLSGAAEENHWCVGHGLKVIRENAGMPLLAGLRARQPSTKWNQGQVVLGYSQPGCRPCFSANPSTRAHCLRASHKERGA